MTFIKVDKGSRYGWRKLDLNGYLVWKKWLNGYKNEKGFDGYLD